MEQSAEILAARLEKAKEVFKDMKVQMDSKDSEIESLKLELSEIKKNTPTINQEKYDEMCASIIELTKERDYFKQRETDLSDALDNLRNDYDKLASNADSKVALTEAYDKLQDEYNKQGLDLSEANKKIEKLTSELEDKKKTITALSDKCTKAEEDFNTLKTTAQDYQKSVKERDENIQKVMDILNDKVSEVRQTVSLQAANNYPGMHDFLSM